MSQPRTPSDCVAFGGRCQSHGAGHNMHVIHANHLGRTPWGWRVGVVERLDAGWIHVRYVETGDELQVWHHDADLVGLLAIGASVRVHEQYYSLQWDDLLFNVVVHGGSGPVPEPSDVEPWVDKMQVGIVELATGRGIAADD